MNASIFDDVTFSGTATRKKICRRGKVGSSSNLVRSRYGRDRSLHLGHMFNFKKPDQFRTFVVQ